MSETNNQIIDLTKDDDDHNNCPICLDAMIHTIVTTNCGHKFHRTCLINTIKNCPICRSELNREFIETTDTTYLPLPFPVFRGSYIRTTNHTIRINGPCSLPYNPDFDDYEITITAVCNEVPHLALSALPRITLHNFNPRFVMDDVPSSNSQSMR